MTFSDALKKEYLSGKIPVIPDIKLYSPKDGDLIRGRDPVRIAEDLARSGAPVLSVVTEEKEFGGSVELLNRIASRVKVPVLRKDFISDVSDLDATVKSGAKAVLLMCSCLDEKTLTFLYQEALTRGLEPFVETHSKEDLDFARRLGAGLVGINNRDILQLERDNGDVSFSTGLLRFAPDTAFTISESSVRDAVDVRKVLKYGAKAVLAGTCILNAADPVRKLHSLRKKAGLKVCGIMDTKGLGTCINSAADLAGMVVDYPVRVPWNIVPEQAAEICSKAKGRIRTCVVTGGPADKILSLADLTAPDFIQLHYTETLEETSRIAGILKERGVSVIRSIPSDPALRKMMFGTADILEAAEKLEKTEVEIILFDSRDASNAANSSESILLNRDRSEEYRQFAAKSTKLIMMGGGINADNVYDVCTEFSPDIIDVMTSSEDFPGKKSPEKINAVCKAIGEGR